jgi:hypothetical protein
VADFVWVLRKNNKWILKKKNNALLNFSFRGSFEGVSLVLD